MTTGAVIYAVGSDTFDYVKLAAWNMKQIHRWLDIPVCVITDQPVDHLGFDHVVQIPVHQGPTCSRWFDDIAATRAWNNLDRYRAFDLTPWDRTLLLDADYVVNSDMLRTLIDSGLDFFCHDRALDASTGHVLDDQLAFGKYRMSMAWATVMLFDRTIFSESIFYMMQMIRNHWNHYRDLYGISNTMYRNDYALSIALNVVSGHTLRYNRIPWPLVTVNMHTKISQVMPDQFRIDYAAGDRKPKWCLLKEQDLHVMSKSSLEQLIDTC